MMEKADVDRIIQEAQQLQDYIDAGHIKGVYVDESFPPLSRWQRTVMEKNVVIKDLQTQLKNIRSNNLWEKNTHNQLDGKFV